MTQSLCPERTVLVDFSRGDLPAEVFEHIAAHVPDCPSCQQVLAELRDCNDPLLAGLRQVQEKDTATPPPNTPPPPHPEERSLASALQTPPGYELLGEVGRGGMGVVHRARDTRLGREVAIKLLREGYSADSAVCARFVAEARITGQLQHPGIPAVHELGQLTDGRPFLAMKLVKGRTLHDLLQERRDPSSERGRFLTIFEQLCQAVGYAHAHRVIHRDLKPGNVMVGAFGEVQVMDWGLAKVLATRTLAAVEEDGLPETLMAVTAIETPRSAGSATRTGSVMGTPAYMAPEQAGGEIRKLDARSDVFGLGAILCEILTGSPPYSGADVNAVRLQAVRGELADTLARLDGCGAEPDMVALCKRCLAFRQEDRPADSGAVAAEVAGIRQAAEERARRAELARAEALVRAAEQRKRRRVWLALAACLLMGLVVSTGLGLWANYARQQAEIARAAEAAAREAEAARAEGERRANLEAVAAKEQAQKRLKQIAKSQEILAAFFVDLDIRQIRQGKEPLEAVLAKRLVKAAEQLEGESVGDPLMVAQLQNQAGVSLLSLGHPRPAITLFEKARAAHAMLLGADHPDTLTNMNNLAESYRVAGQPAKAVSLLEETLRLRRAQLGADHPDTLATMNNLALAYQATGQLDKALPLFKEALRLLKAKRGVDHPDTLTSMNNLALGYRDAGEPAKAVSLLEETLRRRRAQLGADHSDTLTSMNNLALGYQATGQIDKVLPLLQEALRLCQTKLGADHPITLTSVGNLAESYRVAGQSVKAVPLLKETLRLCQAQLGADHPGTLTSMNNLALGYQGAGDWDKARSLFEETLRLRRAKLGADHPDTLGSMNNLAESYQALGQLDKALPLHEETLRLLKAKLGADHPDTLTSMNNLAGCYQAAGRLDKARPLFEETLRLRQAKLGPDHPRTLTSMNNLASVYQALGQSAKALPLFEEALRLLKAKLGADHPDTLITMNNLAGYYQAAGHWDKARPLFEEILRRRQAKLGADHPDTLTSMNNLAEGYRIAGPLDKALLLHEETLRRRRAKLGADHPVTLTSMNNLALSFQANRRLDKALPLFEEALRLLKAKLGTDHPTTLTCMGNLAIAYCEAKRGDKAAPLFAVYFSHRRKRAKPNDPGFAGALANVSHLLLTCEQYKEAETYLRECLAIRAKTQPDAWNTFNAQSLLGWALLGQKQYADAEPLLLKGYQGMKQREEKIPKQGKVRLSEALTRLMQLYDAWGKPMEAAKWRKELAQQKKATGESKN